MNPWTQKAEVIAALCQGCGACAVACPNGATQQQNFTKNQIMNMIDAVLKD
ncbi:MAG: 4Fe-4S binding protein [Acidobacteria bacterium]|nr:4Fe-4S binding protein [Acidobacteriota bacterium]